MSILKLLKCFCSKQKASKNREHEDKCQVPHLRGPRRLYIHLLRLLVWSSQVVVPWVDVRLGRSVGLVCFEGVSWIFKDLQVSPGLRMAVQTFRCSCFATQLCRLMALFEARKTHEAGTIHARYCRQSRTGSKAFCTTASTHRDRIFSHA